MRSDVRRGKTDTGSETDASPSAVIRSAERSSEHVQFYSGAYFLAGILGLPLLLLAFITPSALYFAVPYILAVAAAGFALKESNTRVVYELTESALTITGGRRQQVFELNSIRHLEVGPTPPRGGGYQLWGTGFILIDTASVDFYEFGPVQDPVGWAEAIREAAINAGTNPSLQYQGGCELKRTPA